MQFYPGFRVKKGSRTLAVSEAVGTILLLGISVILTGWVAIWASTVDRGEESVFVDLWASTGLDQFYIVHRGGDALDGRQTTIIIRDTAGTDLFREEYYNPPARTDEYWNPGEELTLPIGALPSEFDLIITTVRPNGNSIVVLKTRLLKEVSVDDLPDLVVKSVRLQAVGGADRNILLEVGTYYVVIEVENNGKALDKVHFSANPDMTVKNLRVFDSADDLSFTSLMLSHIRGAMEVPVSDPGWGLLANGDIMRARFEWQVPLSDPRTLGDHTLSVKVIPLYTGEIYYNNNMVERAFMVDKEVPPYIVTGPDPGIYDIYFSNNVPKSGESVLVTVVIQNSGEETVFTNDHVNLVVSTWEPVPMKIDGGTNQETHDWMMDYPGHFMNWRTEDNSFALTDDDTFPTCVVTDIQLLPGAYLFLYFTIEVRVDVPGGFQWIYATIDAYNTDTTPQGITELEGDEFKDNSVKDMVQVLPRILLVDDDAAPTSTEGDMTSSVLEALIGSGVNVDKVYIAQRIDDTNGPRDAPAFKYDKAEISVPAMEDFDIVIWVTGYTSDGLTNVPRDGTNYGGNVQEIMEHMDNHRYFLLVGEDPLGGLSECFDYGDVTQKSGTVTDLEYNNARAFTQYYLGITSYRTDVDLPDTAPYELFGTDTETDSLTPFVPPEEYTIALEHGALDNGQATMFKTRVGKVTSLPGSTVYEEPVGFLSTRDLYPFYEYMGVRAWSEPVGTYDAQFRVAVLGFDVNKIRYLNENIDLFAAVLKWFDWEIKVGRDLSITGMEMYILNELDGGGYERLAISEGYTPKYLDTVEIEATIRNNGREPESTTLIFYIIGPNGIELPITPSIVDPRTADGKPFRGRDDNPLDIDNLGGSGTQELNFKLWLAVGVGLFTFRVEVDPYHLIPEINEENNDITYSTSTVASFITQNNILIVDDDTSDDNFYHDSDTGTVDKDDLLKSYPAGETSYLIEQVLLRLDYDYETVTVENRYSQSTGTWSFDSTLTKMDLKRFNSIIWVTGDSGDPSDGLKETLTDNDMIAIMEYLDGDYAEAAFLPSDHYENIMFVGHHLVQDISQFATIGVVGKPGITNGGFLEHYLGLIPLSPPYSLMTASHIQGRPSGDILADLYVGMDYGTEHFMGAFEFQDLTLTVPDPLVESVVPVLYSVTGAESRTIASEYRREDPIPNHENYFRTVVQSWQVTQAEHIGKESTINELIYLPLHLFGTPEDTAELVSRSAFIKFEDEHPAILNNYLVRIEVANLGGVSGGGTIRFADGDLLIKSQYIFLDPDTSMTIEATWTPLYAGIRDIKVILDVKSDTVEVLDVLNNVHVKSIDVYFFWDDLEEGSENWIHDAVLATINGESPLDYLDPYDRNPSTNIVKSWDLSMSKGLVETEEVSHSAPVSYWLKEGVGAPVRANVILGLVIDNSPSMFDRKDPSSGKTWLKVAVESAMILVNSLSDDSLVCVWVFSGSNAKRQLPLTALSGTGRTVVMNSITSIANGQMTQIWDGIGSAYIEVKSAIPTYPRHTPAVVALSDGADYQSSDVSAAQITKLEAASGTWAPWHDMRPDLGYPTVNYTKHMGKYTIPYNGIAKWYTAGGGSFKPTRRGLLTADMSIYTIGLALEHHDPIDQPQWAGPWAEAWADPTYAVYTGTGSLESGTTEYNLWRISTTSGAQYFFTPTPDQLDDIFNTISILLAGEAGETRATEFEENYDKVAVTPEFDLSYASSAYITFWHRYNMVGGTNGAFIEIGYQDPAVTTEVDLLTDWDWKYAVPFEGQYSGNLYLASDRYDSFGNAVTWGWTGLSGQGSFDWEYVKVNIIDYVPTEHRDAVRVKFNYTQYGGGTGDGWWIDDVKITVSRDNAAPVTEDFPDMWKYSTGSIDEGTTHSGISAWYAGGPGSTDFNDGVDNSLYTRPIDLTNSRQAIIEMYLRFNIDYVAGRPPDGFRVEVSKDNGLSWSTLNYGARASWGVSGTEADITDGLEDGRSFTGLEDDPGNDHGWVTAGSVTRFVTDLQGFLGNVIILRFRIITNTDGVHYADPNEFKGIYLDDIIISGSSSGVTRGTEVSVEPSQTIDEGRSPVGITENSDYKPTALSNPTVQTVAPIPEPATDSGEGPTISGLWALLLLLLCLFLIVASSRRKGFRGRMDMGVGEI